MVLKEKIIQIWLVFVLTFIGFSKVLIIIPFVLQIQISNGYLINFIDFVFKPADYISDFISNLFLYGSFLSGTLFLVKINSLLIFLFRFLLFAAESYILSWLFIFLLKSKSFKSFLDNLFYTIKTRLNITGDHANSYNLIKNNKYYYLLTTIIIFLLVGAGGYLVLNYNDKRELSDDSKNLKKKISDIEMLFKSRDNRRIYGISELSRALESYAVDNDQYPVTNGVEKISDENSNSFQKLKNGNYLSVVYKDSLSDKYYYGYKSDGSFYVLSAVLENNKDSRCSMEGDLCIYRLKGDIPRCEFPDAIGNYNKVRSSDSAKNFKGLVYQTPVRYQIISSYTSTLDGSFYVFDSRDNANNYLENILPKIAEHAPINCEMGGKKGKCISWWKGRAYQYVARGMLFIWKEGKVVKSVFSFKDGEIGSEGLLEEKVKEDIVFYISKFKDCKVSASNK